MLVVLIFSLVALSQQSTIKSDGHSKITSKPHKNKGEAICHNSTLHPHIYFGTVVPIESREFKYFVTIHSSKSEADNFCGGSIYKSKVIITAAHCVAHRDPRSSYIRLNYDNRMNPVPEDQYLDIQDFDCHSEFDAHDIINDICLVYLYNEITFDDRIGPIDLAGKQYSPHTELVGLGVGIYEAGRKSNELRTVDLILADDDACGEVWPDDWKTGLEICCIGKTGGLPCDGDSGGPLIYNDNGQHIQVGIGSYIEQGSTWPCEPGHISAFTNIFHYIDWIRSRTNLRNQHSVKTF